MITRTSQPASGAMLISEMKEFAGFSKATQRYIRRSLDVAYGRRDAMECWARDEGEAASIRAQARLYKQLDHLRLALVELGEAMQRLVEREQIEIAALAGGELLVQRDARGAAAALLGELGARVIDQDLAHRTRGGTQKMRTVGEADAGLIGELRERFVDEVGRGERVAGTLACEIAARQRAQLVIDERHRGVAGGIR